MSTTGAKHLTELNERDQNERSDQSERPNAGPTGAEAASGCADESLANTSDRHGHSSYSDAPLTENDFYIRVKDYAPNSELGESVLLDPDITLFCEGCERYINISDIKSHGKFHDALHTFHYSGKDRPDNLTALNVCRRTLLKESYVNWKNSGEHPNPALFREIDEAYEIIKADLENNSRRSFGSNYPVVCGTSSKPSASSCIEAVGLCSAINRQWKNEMEEAKVFQDCFGGDPRKCFIGLYSGYNGSNAAKTSSKVLHTYLLPEIKKFSDSFQLDIAKGSNDDLREQDKLGQSGASQNPEINCDHSESSIHEEDAQDIHSDLSHRFAQVMAEAFMKAHHSVDEILSSGEGESSRVRWSGCSTLACLIDCNEEVHTRELKVSEGVEHTVGFETTANETQNANIYSAKSETQVESNSRHSATIHISNAGDVQAVLVRRNKPILLTKMHSMSNKYERHRITQTGGTITKTGKEYRLNGISIATRGLGNHGDPLIKRYVISRPYAASIPIDDCCQFLILASNGVWQVLSHNEAAMLLLQMLPCHFIPPPSALSSTVDVLLHGEQNKSKMSILSDVFEEYDSAVTKNGNSQTELSSKVHTNTSLESVHKHADTLPTAVSGGSDRNDEYKGDLVSADYDVITEDGSDAQKTKSPGDILSKSIGNEGSVSLQSNVSTPKLTLETTVNKEDECLCLSRCMSERLVQAALMAGSKANVTAIVVLFGGRNGVYF